MQREGPFIVKFQDCQESQLPIGVGPFYFQIWTNDGWKDITISNGTRRDINNSGLLFGIEIKKLLWRGQIVI